MYDANGNATARQGYYPTWTSYNYMGSVYAGSGSTEERVDFNYGPDRKRWSQTYYTYSPSSYETTDYIGGLFEQVIGSAITGTIYRYYIYAGSEPIAVYARTSGGTYTFNYMLSDHQGSVSDLTSSTGGSVVNESFTPYGMRRNPATWSGAASNSDLTTAAGITRQAYTFQTQMGLWMGLNHMNGRVQDSMIGRFLSADPHIPDPTNTQSYNRYSYAINNPLTFIDPTGFINQYPVVSGGGGGGFIWGADIVDNLPGIYDIAATFAGSYNGSGSSINYLTIEPSTDNDIAPASSGSTGSTNASSQSGNGFGTGAAVNAFADQLTDEIIPIDTSVPDISDILAQANLGGPQGNQAAGWLGIGATAGEYSSGTSAIGTNGRLYSAPRGNQYFNTFVELGDVFKTLGIGALVFGTASDYFDASQGGSFGQANLNLGIGLAGLASPVYAVPGALYFVISTYYPGGPAAYNAAFVKQLNAAEGGGP